jgi:hypothetical protein
MTHLKAKHDRSKGTVVERVKRRPIAKVVASDLDATTQHNLAVQEAVNDQSIAPNENADKTARSINDDGGFERMKAHWEKYLGPDWKDAPEETRARFLIEVLGYSGCALRVHRGAQGQ